MWGPGWWGHPMWSLGWIFPLIGLAIALVFVVVMARAMTRGGGFMCMHRPRHEPDARVDELLREIRELRDEVQELKTSR